MESSSDEDETGGKSGSVVDMEDLGNMMSSVRKVKVSLHHTLRYLVVYYWNICVYSLFSKRFASRGGTLKTVVKMFKLHYFYLLNL